MLRTIRSRVTKVNARYRIVMIDSGQLCVPGVEVHVGAGPEQDAAEDERAVGPVAPGGLVDVVARHDGHRLVDDAHARWHVDVVARHDLVEIQDDGYAGPMASER